MKEILDEIDEVIVATLDGKSIKAHGLCVQALKGTQVHPITWDKRTQVAINDKWDVTYFHRLLNDVVTEDEENTFGSKFRNRHNQIVRTVVAAKNKLGTDFIDDFINALPNDISLDNYRMIDIFKEQLLKNTDQVTIYNTEFGGSEGNADYEKHRTSWMIYALEYGIDYIKCAVD